MARPEAQTIEAFLAASAGSRADSVAWCLPRFEALVRDRLGVGIVSGLSDVPGDASTLIVVGGGTLMDRAKLWRRDTRPDIRLVVIPSIWGSGAEASRVVVLNRDGAKHIEVGDELLPDVRVTWPELAAGLPADRARYACGDAWSHALEGFLSPLASDELRGELAEIMNTMGQLEIGNNASWFEPSARACAAQARSSVGLIHGIAHVLEGALAAAGTEVPYGHARLTSLMLRPVMAFNREQSPKFDDYAERHGLDVAPVLSACAALFDDRSYDEILPVLEANWRNVLRDACSRTNSALVRPAHLEYFMEKRFQ